MSNNIVELHGYLVIKDISRSAIPDQLPKAAGKPADVILDHDADFPVSTNPDCPTAPTLGVTVRGKLKTGEIRIVWLGDIAVPVMDTILTTEKALTGGAHRVLLSDELANKLEKYVRFYGTDPLPATVSGKLVTVGDRICVLAELLSPGNKSADIPGIK